MSTETKRVAFLVYPGLTPLDLIGPLQALAPAAHPYLERSGAVREGINATR